MRPITFFLFLAFLTVMTSFAESYDNMKCSQSALSSCRCRKKKVVSCDRADCMDRLPTSSLSDSDRENIVNLRVTRQKNLTEISDDDLSGLTNVLYIKIARNHISSIGENAFVDQQALMKLDLHGNRLESVPRAIRHLPDLRQLNLGANRIKSIHPEDFSHNTNLDFLILRNNLIQEFPLHLPQNLVKLSLVHNQISSVGDATRLSKLTLLRLDNNQLTEIPNAHDNISSTVQELTLCTNKLSSASLNRPSALKGLTNLRRLRLSGNPEIRHITSDFLSSDGGRTLRELDLNFCGIEDIVSDAFACAHDIRHVGLAGNRLQMYDIGWLVHNRRLRGVELSGNPWRCTCEFVAQLKSLKKAVEGRIERVVEKTDESDMDKISKTFNNDFYNISCTTVDADLKVDVETEYNNFTSYQNAPCVNNVAEWKFQKRRQTCNSNDVETPEVVAPPVRTVKPTTRRVVEATTGARPTTTRRSTTIPTTTRRSTTRPTTTRSSTTPRRSTTRPTTTRSSTTTRRSTTRPTTARSSTTTTTEKPTTASTTTTTTTTTEEPTTEEPTTEEPTTIAEPASTARLCTNDGDECVWPYTGKDGYGEDGVVYDGSTGCATYGKYWTYQICQYDNGGTLALHYYCQPCEEK